MKEAYIIYMSIMKLSFYWADATITLRSYHLIPSNDDFKCQNQQLGCWT